MSVLTEKQQQFIRTKLRALDNAVNEPVTPYKAKNIQNRIIRPMMRYLKECIVEDPKKLTSEERALFDYYKTQIMNSYMITYNNGFLFSKEDLDNLQTKYSGKIVLAEGIKLDDPPIEANSQSVPLSPNTEISDPNLALQTDTSPNSTSEASEHESGLESIATETLVNEVDEDQIPKIHKKELLKQLDEQKALVDDLCRQLAELQPTKVLDHEEEKKDSSKQQEQKSTPKTVSKELISTLKSYVNGLDPNANTGDETVKKEIQKICKVFIPKYYKAGANYNDLKSDGSVHMSTLVNDVFKDKFMITLRPNYSTKDRSIISIGVDVKPSSQAQAQIRKARKLKKLNHEEKRDYTDTVNHDKSYTLDIESVIQAVIRYIRSRIRNMKSVDRAQIIEIITKLIDNNNDVQSQTFQLSKSDMSDVVDLFMQSYSKDEYTYDVSTENRDQIYQIFNNAISSYVSFPKLSFQS